MGKALILILGFFFLKEIGFELISKCKFKGIFESSSFSIFMLGYFPF